MLGGTLNEDDFGHRLIPHVIDEYARKEPQRECFSIPRSSNPKDGWRAVTFKEYANAINHISHMIVEKCGRPPANTIPALAYIGPNDARYVVLLIAAIKAGYAALYISPRNPSEAQITLFDKTDCRFICFPASHRGTVEPWLQQRSMVAIEVPPVDDWFPSYEVEPVPYGKTFEQAEWETFGILHTSGSTGFPKPIVIRQGMLSSSDAYHNLPDWNGLSSFIQVWSDGPKRIFLPFPLFHAGGLFLFLVRVVYWGNPIAIGLPDRPLSSDSVVECLDNLDVEGILLPPAILEEMSQSAHYTQSLSKLKIVAFGGGDLSKNAGNKLSRNGVTLMNVIGATEIGAFPVYVQSNPDLWHYFVINSDVFGAEWRKAEVGDDGVYRLVIVRKSKTPGYQGCFYTFPDNEEYDTGDLYKSHPTLPDYWLYVGRSDNIIVFSNGEKLNPVTIEEQIEQHPLVKGAQVFGSGRFQAGLLVEPLEHLKDDDEVQSFIESIWPSVENVNKETVAHGQISREFIMLSNPQKPFPRGGKGNIQRAKTVKLYQDEIDQLYERAGDISSADVAPFDLESEDALTESIMQAFQTRLGSKGEMLEQDTDFFSVGIDSLQVINATRLLRAGLEAVGHHIDVTTRAMYNNPSLRRLATYIYLLVREGASSTLEGDDKDIVAMDTLWKKYTTDLPQAKEGRQDPLDENQTIILTGSTGSLGSYLLDLLTRNPAVKKVVCLNRAEDGGKMQQARAMADRGLSDTYDSSKCTLLHADMAQPDFGLGRETYEQLLRDTDRIIHNAWPVNFNIPFETFEPHLQGVRNIANFAAEASKRVAVIFISSIGTVDRWNSHSVGPIPERRLEHMGTASTGYGRSKLIGSLILEDAAKSGDFPVATIRVGQIAGPESEAGCWNRHEMFPTVIASGLYLKALPSDLGHLTRVDWIPIEKMASMVLEIAGISQRVPANDINGHFHGVNPNTVSWSELAQSAQEFYGKDRIPQLVSLQDWVAQLEKSGAQGAADKNPGVKLLDTYMEMSVSTSGPLLFDLQRTLDRSSTMRSLSAVTPQLMKHWCKQWAFQG
ncbi:nonribosomal peptide synthetase [Hypoxylon crocopeplum]|nr:nonribosomal peptide synthetase [Hypoxylon crocopeplum]